VTTYLPAPAPSQCCAFSASFWCGRAILVIINPPIFLDLPKENRNSFIRKESGRVGVTYLKNSLLADDLRGAALIEEQHTRTWSQIFHEILEQFGLRRKDITSTWLERIARSERAEQDRLGKTTAREFLSMRYEDLRTIADTDAIADRMSEDEYESLSLELWKKFRAERRQQ
jgi:hypothetical protein